MSEIARILREQEKIRRELRGLSGGRNLSFSAIENGAIADYDADGTLRTVIGRQPDGTHTIRHVDGPVPPQPTAPAVEVDGPVLRVAWDGMFAAGEQVPEDFSRVDVHVAAGSRETVAGNLTTREGSAVVLKAQQSGVHAVTLVARSLSGKSSPASEAVEVDVTVASFSGAIEAVAQSANGKNVVTYATAAPTTEDAGTEGDTWWVNESRLRDPEDPESEEYVAITEQWRHDGTEWVAVELAHEVIASVDLGTATVGYLNGQRIVASTIDTEQLRSTAIDGMVITGATVQTSHEHPKTMMDASGFHVTDAEGQDQISLTPDGGDFLSLRGADGSALATVSDEGVISGTGLNVQDDPVFMGRRLLGSAADFEHPSALATSIIDSLPRGVIARAETSHMSAVYVENGERAFFELQYFEEAGRTYRVTIEPWALEFVTSNWAQIRVRRATDGFRPTLGSPELRVWTMQGLAGSWLWVSGSFTYTATVSRVSRVLFTVNSPGRLRVRQSSHQPAMTVEDIGPRVDETGVARVASTEVGKVNNDPAPPEVKNYTTEYKATGVRNWVGGSPLTSGPVMVQGNHAASPYRSAIQFPSMTAALSGATITSIRAYLYFSHWQENSGGTADIHLHGDATLTSTFPSTFVHAVSVPGWPKPGGMWVDIPEQFWAGFKSGQYRGIGLGKADGGDYGRGPWADAKLEIKYRK